MGMEQAWLIPAIPAAAFVVLLLFGRYPPRPRGRGGGPASPGRHGWDWVSFGEFELRLGFQVDQLTVVMLAVVTFVGLMVQVYSTGYMRGDPRYGWDFAAMLPFFAVVPA